jgi:hypothetical protein
LLKNKRSGQAREQRLEWKRLGVNARSSAAAEKSGEGMALKIFTGAKPFLKADIKPFGITGIEMLPSRIELFLDFFATYWLKVSYIYMYD